MWEKLKDAGAVVGGIVSRWRSLTPVIIMTRYTRVLGRGENFLRMASDRIYCEILQRAAEVAGGEDKLAQHLDVRSEDMHDWVQGRATAPAGVYLLALDVLLALAENHHRAGSRD